MDERRTGKKELLDTATAFCSVLVLVFFNKLFKGLGSDIFGRCDVNAALIDILATMISLLGTILVLKLFTGKTEKSAPNGEFSFRELLGSGVFVFGLGYLFRISYAHFVSFLSFIQPSDVKGKGFLVLSLYFVSSVVLPSIFEEIIFREKIFLVFEKYRGAIFFTSILFAISHGGFHSVINAFVFGLLIQYVYYRSRRLGYCIIIHFINNLIAFLAAVAEDGSVLQRVANTIPYIFAICGIVFLIYTFAIVRGRRNKDEQ